jgi:hypothetical protein
MLDMWTSYPELVTLLDIGDSWEKAEYYSSGHDIACLLLTNSAVAGPKPDIFVIGAVEPLGLAGMEVAMRFAEHLVSEHGSDPDVTWILDYHEVHVIAIANPDGRKQAESGLYWYKNTNINYCGPASDYRGANLNHNFPFEWGCCGGSSGDACSQWYRGSYGASEPETQAIVNYLESILPDMRPNDLGTPAPDTTMGIVIDLKAYGGSLYWSWGFYAGDAPNTGLRTLGRKLAYLNGYMPRYMSEVANMDGTLLDFAYGELGVATYAVYLGTVYFEACSSFANTVLPDNMDMLMAAAKVARAPYLLPSGPDAMNVAVGTPVSGAVTITATIDDTRFSSANGAEPTQNIAAAKFYVDTPPWSTSPVPVGLPMWPADGSFDSKVEDVTATLNITGLPTGKHIIFVSGQDAGGAWGAVSAAFLDIPSAAVGTDERGAVARIECRLHPVPFRESTSIDLSMPSAGPVTVEVLDMRGRLVKSLSSEVRSAGTHSLLWDGRDDAGRTAAPGVYVVRVSTPGAATTVKAVVLK